MAPDRIDDAIDAAAAPTDELEIAPYTQVKVTLNRSGGRDAYIGVPNDLTEAEALELVGWIGNGLLAHLVAMAPPAMLEVARAMPRRLE